MTTHQERIEDSLDKEQDEYRRMLLALALYDPQPEIVRAIKAAYDSNEWDWTTCDGCTGVSELHFPQGYRFPPCVRHDFDCWMASTALTNEDRDFRRGIGDELFYRSQLAFGVSPWRARLRWLGVRTYWQVVGRWLPLSGRDGDRSSGCDRCRGL